MQLIVFSDEIIKIKLNQTPWPESASELYRPKDRRSSEKLVPTIADRGCHVVSVTDPYGRIFGFLDLNSKNAIQKYTKQ
jgi:hypothetical protein